MGEWAGYMPVVKLLDQLKRRLMETVWVQKKSGIILLNLDIELVEDNLVN